MRRASPLDSFSAAALLPAVTAVDDAWLPAKVLTHLFSPQSHTLLRLMPAEFASLSLLWRKAQGETVHVGACGANGMIFDRKRCVATPHACWFRVFSHLDCPHRLKVRRGVEVICLGPLATPHNPLAPKLGLRGVGVSLHFRTL